MKLFIVDPYIGALPIRFGMTPEQVAEEIGPPDNVTGDSFGNRCEMRDQLSIGYSATDNTMVEAVFTPGAKLLFQDQDLFCHTDPIRLLRQFDETPFLWVGFVIFQKLGIRLSGFHDDDETQKAIAVVRKGYWDEYVADFVPYT